MFYFSVPVQSSSFHVKVHSMAFSRASLPYHAFIFVSGLTKGMLLLLQGCTPCLVVGLFAQYFDNMINGMNSGFASTLSKLMLFQIFSVLTKI